MHGCVRTPNVDRACVHPWSGLFRARDHAREVPKDPGSRSPSRPTPWLAPQALSPEPGLSTSDVAADALVQTSRAEAPRWLAWTPMPTCSPLPPDDSPVAVSAAGGCGKARPCHWRLPGPRDRRSLPRRMITCSQHQACSPSVFIRTTRPSVAEYGSRSSRLAPMAQALM